MLYILLAAVNVINYFIYSDCMILSDCEGSVLLPQKYNPEIQVCCGSRIYTKLPSLACCYGTTVYDPQTSICDADKHRVVTKQHD